MVFDGQHVYIFFSRMMQVPNEAAAQTLYNDALDTARVDMDREIMRLQAISHAGSNTSSSSSSAADAPSMSGSCSMQRTSSAAAAGTADESEEAAAQTLPAEVLARITQLKVRMPAAVGLGVVQIAALWVTLADFQTCF